MSDALIARLVSEIRAAILLLNREDKGGHAITPDQADERARKIAQNLVINFELRELPGPYTVDFADPRISPPRGAFSKLSELQPLYDWGKPIGHSETCKCDRCADFNLKLRERI